MNRNNETRTNRDRSRVCRRLFPNSHHYVQACYDNITNFCQEEITKHTRQKSEEWGYDFENDRPLDGIIDWVPGDDRYTWIGRVKAKKDESEDQVEEGNVTETKEEECSSIRDKNEVTPETNKGKDNFAPIVKKRRADEEGPPTECVRRRLSFD